MDIYNILITNVSKINERNFEKEQPQNYVDEANTFISGRMTNEAPIKSIINKLSGNLNEIIFICSNAVLNERPVVNGNVQLNGKKILLKFCKIG